MRRKLFLISFMIFGVFNSQAENVSLTPQDCYKLLPDYVAEEDISYRPEDFKGKPVDLNSQKVFVPQKIGIDLELQPNIPLPPNTPIVPRASLGKVEVKQDGTVLINGKAIGDHQTQKIRKYCNSLLKTKNKEVSKSVSIISTEPIISTNPIISSEPIISKDSIISQDPIVP